jgi:hypothetical protein
MRMLSSPAIQALGALSAALLIPVISAAPNGRCEVGETWRDWNDCHGFFECAAGGIPVRKVCGPKTAYSPHIGVCDYEWKVPTCHRGSHGHKEEGGHHGHGGDDKKKDHHDHGDDEEEEENNDNWRKGYRLGASEAGGDEGSCHVGSAWPDKVDCRNFWECAAGGVPVRKSCGPGTAFSPELGVCDHESEVRSCHHHKNENEWSAHTQGEGGRKDDEGDDKKWEQEEFSSHDEHQSAKNGQNDDKEGNNKSQNSDSPKNNNQQWAKEGQKDDKEDGKKLETGVSSDKSAQQLTEGQKDNKEGDKKWQTGVSSNNSDQKGAEEVAAHS